MTNVEIYFISIIIFLSLPFLRITLIIYIYIYIYTHHDVADVCIFFLFFFSFFPSNTTTSHVIRIDMYINIFTCTRVSLYYRIFILLVRPSPGRIRIFSLRKILLQNGLWHRNPPNILRVYTHQITRRQSIPHCMCTLLNYNAVYSIPPRAYTLHYIFIIQVVYNTRTHMYVHSYHDKSDNRQTRRNVISVCGVVAVPYVTANYFSLKRLKKK
jgi:hypothetical protein